MTELHPHHNPPPDNIYDVTFIGAGPSALFGAFYAGMRQMSCKLIDNQAYVGGQLTALYPEKWIFDAPGYPKILAKDLAGKLLEQASHWNPKICLNERINTLRIDDVLTLTSEKGVHKTRTLIIAAGQGSMIPNRLQNEKLNQKFANFENKNIFYTLRNKNRYLQKRVLVVGGGDSAMDGALNLKDYASEVTLIHRSDNYKAMPATVAEVIQASNPTEKQPKPAIDFRPFYEVKDVLGNNKLEGAIIFNNKTKEETKLDLDYILLLLGFKPDPDNPIRNWGLEFIKELTKDGRPLPERHIKVNSRQETNIPGVYAIGDIAENPEVVSMGLIASGYGQAPIAVSYADVYIHPEKSVKTGHSSNLKL